VDQTLQAIESDEYIYKDSEGRGDREKEIAGDNLEHDCGERLSIADSEIQASAAAAACTCSAANQCTPGSRKL